MLGEAPAGDEIPGRFYRNGNKTRVVGRRSNGRIGAL